MEGENELNLNSVIEASSPWKEKATGSYLAKLIRLENGSSALLLREDCSRPLRFLYLALLMSKKNAHNMSILLSKVAQIKSLRKSASFANLAPEMARLVGCSLEGLHAQLIELQRRLEGHSFSHTAILRLSHEFALVDPLLVLGLRVVAEDYKMMQALDCAVPLGLGQVELLASKFFVDRGALVSPRNKYVLFWPLTEVEYEFFRARGVAVGKESECFDELSDPQTLKYDEYLMIEKAFSLL